MHDDSLDVDTDNYDNYDYFYDDSDDDNNVDENYDENN